VCGIAGCVAPHGAPPDRDALDRMAASLRHRGPDDQGIEVFENVGLVSTRLAIVDPTPAGHQPMWDPSGRWLLAYNGEIYNHEGLRTEFSADGWRGHSDTETLVHALAAWGESAVERLNGPLAAAAVDRARRRLLLVRDRFGKKPLYVARHDGALWFASEIKALRAAGVPGRLRREILEHMAFRGWASGRATPLEGVSRVLPGTLVTVSLDTLSASERRWHDPARSVDPELARELESLPRRVQADRLEGALRVSVRRRLMADVPVGTMCSGGLDSSLVTALARDEHGSATAFNCSLVDEPEADEGRHGEEAAMALGVDLETVRVSAPELRAALVEAVRVHEYPLASVSSVPIAMIAARARDRGVKVLLTGEGADELFAGYPLAHAGPELRFLPASVVARRYGLALLRRRVPVRGMLKTWSLPVPPAPSVAASTEQVRTDAERAYSHHARSRARFEARLLASLTHSTFPFLLNRMDKDAMAGSVETRVPFLDPDVVRLALNIPLEARTQPRLKGVLRDVARRHLPPSIANRPKYPGLSFNASRRIEEAAHPDFLADGFLRQALRQPQARWQELREAGTRRTGLRLWTAEIWTRLFLEGHSVAQVEADLWRSG
jgi:asparagine synthase (glutamine-hydrolysing)